MRANNEDLGNLYFTLGGIATKDPINFPELLDYIGAKQIPRDAKYKFFTLKHNGFTEAIAQPRLRKLFEYLKEKDIVTHFAVEHYFHFALVDILDSLIEEDDAITGVSGSGKSILAKQDIVNLYLADKNADIIVIDPEREYKIVEALGGECIILSATSPHHINAMDMNQDYGDGANPVTLKSEFILSLCEQLMGSLDLKQKSIIDRCTILT